MTNSSLLLHDSCSILYCSMALVFTSLSSFFLISAKLCLQFKKKKSRRVREEFPISLLRMKWLTVTLFLNKQRKENVCFCWFFFFLFRKHFTFLFFPLVHLLNHKSQSVREFQGNCKELATPIVMIPQSDKLTLQ